MTRFLDWLDFHTRDGSTSCRWYHVVLLGADMALALGLMILGGWLI